MDRERLAARRHLGNVGPIGLERRQIDGLRGGRGHHNHRAERAHRHLQVFS
jgi:hypothetical protein